jgi:membrane-bound lytic murein transglycosylase D
MKKLLFITLILSISGCQLMSQTGNNSAEQIVYQGDVATPVDIHDALLKDETADVVHPVEDVEFQLDDDTVVVNDIWQRIRQGITFPVVNNRQVAAQRNWYLSHPEYLDRVAKRAEPFIYYIIEQLEQNNMPIEIALLPVVESAYDPFAYSHGRASGMWQFVPNTGERFDMPQNWWYDGRRDVIASTQGAISYLKYLYSYFDNDWLLALAAYNSGEGRVKRAMKANARKHLPTDYWSIQLPKETQDYVPKLLALVDIVKNTDRYDVKLYQIANKPLISIVDIESQLDLAKAAELAEISLPELQRLNPGFNRWATPPDGPHYLVVPKKVEQKFVDRLAKLPAEKRIAFQRYKVKSGDSLLLLAKKFNTTTELIKKLNHLDSNLIQAGKYLLIPTASADLDEYILSSDQRISATQNKQRNGNKIEYTVQNGDSLWKVAKKYNVSIAHLAKWNGMAPKDTLKVGQKLVIWQPTDFNLSSEQANQLSQNRVMRNITYKVRRGDSFARIAQKFNVKISDIEKWNNVSRHNYLQPGQKLKLTIDVTNNI